MEGTQEEPARDARPRAPSLEAVIPALAGIREGSGEQGGGRACGALQGYSYSHVLRGTLLGIRRFGAGLRLSRSTAPVTRVASWPNTKLALAQRD